MATRPEIEQPEGCKKAARTLPIKSQYCFEAEAERESHNIFGFKQCLLLTTSVIQDNTMDSDQIPPPRANITFPPKNRNRLILNYLDSFVTSWVTPQLAETPCHISLYFWINSTLNWQRVWNQTAPLNGTTTIPLDYLTAPGLGQVNLNYHDPDDGSSFKVTSGIFRAIHDPHPIAPSSKLWNSDALTKTSATAPTAQPSSSTAAPTALATSVLATVTATATLANAAQAPTSSTSDTDRSIASPSVIANIVVGSVLGLLIMALLAMAWFRWRKKRQRAKPTTLGHHDQSAVKPPTRYLGWLREKDARNTPIELSSVDRCPELSAESDSRVELSTTQWRDRSATPAPGER